MYGVDGGEGWGVVFEGGVQICVFFFGCVLGFLMKGEVDKREV